MLQSLFAHVALPLAWIPGTAEWIIIAAFGLILFGKRLPEVGRSLGKGIVEFKKGLKGVEEEVETASNAPAPQITHSASQALPHKFDPYTGKPIEEPAKTESQQG
jgi:sec-independent protein translocase protein TatA